MSNIPLRIYCKNCGAPAGFDIINQTYRCPFCGSKLIGRDFSCPEQMPELIIPFFITPEEARQRLLDWGHKNQKTPEGRSVVSSMNKLHGLAA